MFKKFIFQLFIISLFFISQALANVKINAGFFQNSLDLFYSSDLLFSYSTKNQIFWVQLINDHETKLVALQVEFSTQTNQKLFQAQTKFFRLDANTSHFLTNINLADRNSIFGIVHYDTHQIDEFKKTITELGRVPGSTYSLQFTLIDKDNTPLETTQVDLFVNDLPQITLLSPGAPTRSRLQIIYTQFPLFQWESTAREFVLIVCEKSNQESSPEEIIQNDPHLKIESNERIFQYPLSGTNVRPLLPNHEYYWQIESKIQTSSGTESIFSEIWRFKIGESTTDSTKNINELLYHFSDSDKELLRLLQELFKDPEFKQLYTNFLLRYKNYRPTGEIFVDNKLISIEEFASMIEWMNQQGYQVLKVDIK